MPKKMTIEQERKDHCDLIIERAAQMMVTEVGASIPMMLDRLLTYAGAQACMGQGSRNTAKIFREMAANIDRGVFFPITGEDQPKGQRH